MHPAPLVLPSNSKFASTSRMDNAVVMSTAHCLGADTVASVRRVGSSYSVLQCAGNLRILTRIAEFYHKLDYQPPLPAADAPGLEPADRQARNRAGGARCAGSIRAILFGHTHADELTAGLWTVGTQTFERDDRLFKSCSARKTRSVGVKPLHGQRQLARYV
ncbi:hypothetical protein ACHAQF_004321 [Verticillium nonalfalfae]